MANTNAPFGLRPVYKRGIPYNGGGNYYFATGTTGVIAVGDPVTINGTSNTAEFMGFPAGTLPGCQLATAGTGNEIAGVCVGVKPITRASTQYREDSTDRIIIVEDDPFVTYECQQNAGGTIATTDVGLFVVLAAGTALTTVNVSQWVINAATAPAATVAYQLYLERLSTKPGNATGAYAVWEVTINNHQRANVADAGRFTPV